MIFFLSRKKTQEPSDDEVVEIDKHNEDLEAKYVSYYEAKYFSYFEANCYIIVIQGIKIIGLQCKCNRIWTCVHMHNYVFTCELMYNVCN